MRGHRYFVRGCLSAALSAVVGAGMTLAPAPASAQTGISGARTSLKLFWRAAVGDNFTSRDESEPNYERIRVEGHIFASPHPGTSPLKLFYHAGRNDSSLVGTAKGEAEHIASGYTFVRIEGYAFQQPFPGTVPLKLYWHAGRGDNAVVADPRSQQDQVNSGYQYVRVEGYVFPANDPDFGIRKFGLRALVPGQTARMGIPSTKTAFIHHADTAGNGCPYTWIGTTGRHPHDVVLTICNTGVVGMAVYNGTLYEIDPFELDREEVFDYRPPPSTLPLSPVGTIIDVGIAYSPAVLQEYGAMAKSLGLSIEPRLYLAAYQQLAVDHGNAILGASGAATTLRLARTKQLSIFESAFSSTDDALGAIAERGYTPCTQGDDPYGAKAFRDFTGADLVSIWLGKRPSNFAQGAGWIGPSTWYCDDKLAYSVVWGADAVFTTFIHEIGHNLGLLHAHGEPTDWYDYDILQAAPYIYGYVNATNGFRDVMAYGDKCEPTSSACPELPYFSTPDVRVDAATKARVASGGVALGTSNANGARRIRERSGAVAGYRTLKCPGTMTSCGGGTGGTPPTSPDPDPELPPTQEK